MSIIFLSFILSIICSFIFIKVIIVLFYKYKITDNPLKYKKKRDPIPYSTWVIFYIIFFLISYFFIEHNLKLYLIWFFWWIVTITSFIDDLFNINAKIRLLIQIIIWATIWITSIKIWYVSNIFWWILNLETYFFELYNLKIFIIPLLFTIMWYVFVFNALNWTDWIEWNTSWLSIISFTILFLLWFILFNRDNYEWWVENAKFIMFISVIIVWTLIPFWFFDIKEKILMWDSWTMFLGFMLATVAIISWGKIATVLVVFWIYSVDAIYVLIKRIISKKSPLAWDFTHLHHRLLKIWLNRKEILIIVYSFSFLFWISALFLNKTWKIIIFLIIVLIVVFLNKWIELISKKIKKWR